MDTLASDPWVACYRPNPQARLRLFCFPYAGGGALTYRTWPDVLIRNDLPALVEVFPVQIPGRETRLMEPPFTQLAPLEQAVAQALRPYLGLPFAFFGHSMGALIGFELARHLRRQGSPGPLCLFVSAHRAPHLPDPHPPIHALPTPAFVQELRHLNGTPEAVLQNAELMDLLLPLLRADLAVDETYVYADEEPLDCPISCFGGLQDRTVEREELEAWRDHTRGPFTLRTFPGDHFFLNSARAPLLRALSQDLACLAGQVAGG
jgi:medium-chain acyl-[acyl-carrier-protein] hydrolase